MQQAGMVLLDVPEEMTEVGLAEGLWGWDFGVGDKRFNLTKTQPSRGYGRRKS
jgi:hypothetical protein